ncbi:exported hypothetical protein [Candidatus Sulfopaludibacter sp. SbA3]|nr:exported hypothetical protein [Candidatus Sulfopaludibacter sp. SbA3]
MKRAHSPALVIPVLLLLVALLPLHAGSITASCSDFTVPPSGPSSFSCGQFDSTLGVLTELQFMGTLSTLLFQGNIGFFSSGSTDEVRGSIDLHTTLSGITVGASEFIGLAPGLSGFVTCSPAFSGGFSCYGSWSSSPLFDPQAFNSPAFADPMLLQTAVGIGDWSPSLSTTMSCNFEGGHPCLSVYGSMSFTGVAVQYDYSNEPQAPEPATWITLAAGIAVLATRAMAAHRCTE